MSIKQNGGVFGRNPTFNDVTIEGDLIINGEVFSGLDFQGSWNASTNSPALASGTGTKGEFYIVSVAGTTNLDGITNWGIGDWALFNGTVWQRVEGGADGNFNALTANSLLVNGDATVTGGNLIIGTSGKGIDFSATAGTGTSELFDDYEEGTFTPVAAFTGGSGTITYGTQDGSYTKVGNLVTIRIFLVTASLASRTGNMTITGLPFTSAATYHGVAACGYAAGLAITAGQYLTGYIPPSDAKIQITRFSSSAGTSLVTTTQWSDNGGAMFTAQYTV